MEILEKAQEMQKKGIDVVHLEVGEPDFELPECVANAVHKAVDDGHTHYTHSLGMPQLRAAICNYYKQQYHVLVEPEQVLVTSGSSPAILLVLMVLLNAGDEILMSDPGYACYDSFVQSAGGVSKKFNIYESDGYQINVSAVQQMINQRTRGVFVNSPMNPTGVLQSPEVLKQLAELPVPVISDEIYHGLTYGCTARSMLEFTDNAFILNGFSKLFAMTGLRLGYVIAPKKYMRALQILHQNLFISACSLSQYAGIAALTQASNDVENRRKIYDARRIYLIERLRGMGFSIEIPPQGAFYVYVNAQHMASDSYKLAFDILEKAHVGVTPGVDFGSNGEGYLRFSYANSIENIEKGMNRLQQYIISKGL